MKLTNQQFLEVCGLATQLKAETPELRIGQALFNALYMTHRELAKNVIETDADPFYDDSRVKEFINFIL